MDDSFTDGERATQTLPGSAAWYTSAAAASLTVSNQALVFPGDVTGAQHIVTYFTPSGSPQALGVGDTLTASFDFTPTTPVDAPYGWRFGLLNSGGNRVTADNLTTNHANYTAWTGYAVLLNPGSTSSAQFYERTGSSTALIASSTAYVGLGTASASQIFSTGVTYNCVMTVTRTATGIDLALSFSGGTLSNYTVTVSDNTSAFTSFDAFAMSINRIGTTPGFASLKLDNAYVAYSPLLDDQFVDNERITQSFPTSAAWITSAAGTSLTVSSQQLVFPGDTTAPQHIVTYFTPSGTPKAVGVNERLTASFTFSVTSPIDVGSGWRLGIFNSGGNRVTTDAQTTAHANFNAWTGYAAFVNPGGTSTGQLWERTGTNTTLLTTSVPYTALGTGVAGQPFTAGTTYTGKLTLLRTASGLDLSLQFSGGAISSYLMAATDASPSTSFDALAMTINRTGTTPCIGTLTLDNVVVEHAYNKPLTVTGITATDKVYDGTVAAAINTGSAALSGVTAGDTVTLNTTGATGAFATKTVGGAKTVNISGLTLAGADAGKYYIVQPTATANITSKTISVTGVTGNDKAYDGTTSATLNTAAATLVGVLGGDVVTLNAAAGTGTFADAAVGTAKVVTVAGLSLSGTDAVNYILTQPTTTASITPLILGVTGALADDKTYDRTTAAVIDLSGAALTGVVGADSVALVTTSAVGVFATSNAGAAITVNISGLSLSGVSSANYALPNPQATAAADIATKDLAVLGITANNKAYDGTTAATLNTAGASLSGVIGGDTVTLNTASAVGNFSDPATGVGKLVTISGVTISGANAANYSVTQPTALADITTGGASLLSDGFTDGERATQSLPGTAAWYTSAATATLTVSSQKLVFPGDPNGPQHILAYFTASGSPRSLAVGESLSLSFSFTPTDPIDLARGFRFGLFNSGGNRVTADNLTTAHVNYTNWTGYSVWINPVANATGVELGERNLAATALIGGQSAYTVLGANNQSQTLTSGTTYHATLTLIRTSTGLALEVNLTGGTLSNYVLNTTDTTPITTSFDSLAIDISRQSTPTQVPAFSSLTLDDVTVTTGTAPVSTVMAAYEMLGNPTFGCQQGDLNDDHATKATFTVMKTGRLYQLLLQTQGARANARWGDAHTGGTGGRYKVRIYSPAAGGSVASTGATLAGDPQGSMTLRGANGSGTGVDWYPAAVVGGLQIENLWTLAYKGSNPTANQNTPVSVTQYVGGTKVQNWMTRTIATQVSSGTPPPGWAGSRAENISICYVDLFDTAGNAGIAVTAGEVLCVSHENQDSNYPTHFTHNNEAHASYAPVPGYGLSSPLDPNGKVYYNNGSRDWRKVPHIGVQIDGTWYGQPFFFSSGSNTATDESASDSAVRLIHGTRYARQVITPKVGYNRTMNKLWVHAVRYTGGGYTTDGILEVRIRRAPVTTGTPNWSTFWPADGTWSQFPTGTFASSSTVISPGALGSGQVADSSTIVRSGYKTLSPSLSMTGNYSYSIELRVAPASSNTAFYSQALYNPYHLYTSDRPTGAVDITANYPTLLPFGGSGQNFNQAQISNDSGSNWSQFYLSYRLFPIAFEPDPL